MAASSPDFVRIAATVNGTGTDVLPASEAIIHPATSFGLVESGTATWVKHNLYIGWHYVQMGVGVQDWNQDGHASAVMNARGLIVRMYAGQ
jgi:hypothetical protein